MPHRNQSIFDEGWKAWTEGAEEYENPWADGGRNFSAWEDGWHAAKEDFEEQESRRDSSETDDYADWKYHQRD